MRKTMIRWATLGMLLVFLLTAGAVAAEPVSTTIGVSITLAGTLPETPETFTVRMQADGDFPMPAGAAGQVYDLKMTGASSATFPEITYSRVGVYTYKVLEVAGTTPRVQYDRKEYQVKVTVYNNDSGGFGVATAIREIGEGTHEKLTDITFHNVYPVKSLKLEKTITAITRNGQPVTDLTKAQAGDVVTYTITVINDGEAEVPVGTVINDTMTVTKKDGSKVTIPHTLATTVELVPTAEVEEGKVDREDLTYTYTVQADDFCLDNVAVADYPGENPPPEVHEPVQSLKLEKTLTAITRNGEAITDLSNAQIGDVITYTITVTNTGEADIPAGTKVTDKMTVTKKDGSKVVITTELATTKVLKTGESEQLTYTYTVQADDVSMDNAVVSDIPGETPPIPVHEPVQSLKLEKSATQREHDGETINNPTTAQAGDVITYTITVTNTGEADIPAGTKITDTMTVTKKDGTTETITTELATTKILKAGESEQLTYTYTVAEDDLEIENLVVSEIPGETPPPVVVPVSSIVIEKTATSEPANGTAYISGETITYSIVVTNDGDTTLTDVVVTDELTGDEWTVDSLAPGETEEFEAEYVVTDEDAEAGTVLNVATVTANDPDEVPIGDEDDEEDPIDGTLDLTVRKVWNDQNNVAEIRPNRLVVTLNANGTAIQTVTLNADNNWTATVEDLPAYDANGQPITYSWTEAEVLGYTQTGNVADGNTTTITNTYRPTPPIPVTIDEYETPLGLDVEINHVGDTFD